MIGFLKGHVLALQDDIVTIGNAISGECTVGYEVHVLNYPAFKQFCELWIHEVAPQDAPHELYGFVEMSQRELFRRLLNVKGVGPKVAMRIVDSKDLLTTDDGSLVFDAFNAVARLTKIRGVGATLAQRIVEAFQ